MLKKLTLAVAALAVSAACFGASSASAATLYKAASKVGGTVPVGETFTAKMPTLNPKDPSGTLWYQYGPSGGSVNECAEISVEFKVTQNSGGVFKATPAAGKFPLCNIPVTGWPATGLPPLEVSGSSISVGSNTAWLGTKLGMRWQNSGLDLYGASFSGATGNPPTKGVYVREPTAAKAPVSIVLEHAGTVTPEGGGALSGTTVSATFIFTGAAAAWSFQ